MDEVNAKGIRVDEVKLAGHLASLKKREELLKQQFTQEMVNQGVTPFNINKPKRAELHKLFFEELKLPVIEKGKTGPSLNGQVLAILSKQNILAGIYADIKSAERKVKLVDNIKKGVRNGRIYPQLKLNGASSGRFTCIEPNIQQFPEEIRDIILPDEGILVYIDYHQIEYRVQAVLAKDERAIASFKRGEDEHTRVANDLGISRDKAKIVNYGISYGITPFGLAKELETDEHEAKKVIDSYFASKPEVVVYKKKVIKTAKKSGYVNTLYGFQRKLSEIVSKRASGDIDEQVWSTHIQGSAADLVKKCMVDVAEFLESTNSGVILANMHDALLIDLKDMSKLDEIVAIFENVDERFQLAVDTKIGKF